jgi:hypothetical protein
MPEKQLKSCTISLREGRALRPGEGGPGVGTLLDPPPLASTLPALRLDPPGGRVKMQGRP